MPPNKYLLKSIAGNFVFNNTGKFLFEEKTASKLKNYQNIEDLPEKTINIALSELSKPELYDKFYKNNITLTKQQIKSSYSPDIMISKVITTIDDLEKATNMLITRLRNWYKLYNPEFTSSFTNNDKFVELILKKDRKTLLKEINVKESESMGFDLNKQDLAAIKDYASSLIDLFSQKQRLDDYLKKVMKDYCPNLLEIAGSSIAARLLQHAGSLKNLMEMPASKLQLIGAEKALFRHLTSKARCPKHGLIFAHPLISSTKAKYHGKAARALADKLALAAKVDYFKGEFIGKRLRSDLEKKVKAFK